MGKTNPECFRQPKPTAMRNALFVSGARTQCGNRDSSSFKCNTTQVNQCGLGLGFKLNWELFTFELQSFPKFTPAY